MRFVYMGRFDGNYDNLPKADLPANAVIYDEPENLKEVVKAATAIGIITVLPFVCIISARVISAVTADDFSFNLLGFAVGCIAFFLSLIPHELIHGICWGKDAEVKIYNAIRQGVLFVTSTKPMTKRKFIFMSAAPNIVFGIIPFIIYLFTTHGTFLCSFTAMFSICSLSGAGGDIMNIFNTLKQVPKGAMTVLSGIHTYWYEVI